MSSAQHSTPSGESIHVPPPRDAFVGTDEDDDDDINSCYAKNRQILQGYDVTSDRAFNGVNVKAHSAGVGGVGDKRRKPYAKRQQQSDKAGKTSDKQQSYIIVNQRRDAAVTYDDDDDDDDDDDSTSSSDDSRQNIMISNNQPVASRSGVRLSPELHNKKPADHTRSQNDVTNFKSRKQQNQHKQTNIISRKKSKSKSPAVQSPSSESSVMGVAVAPRQTPRRRGSDDDGSDDDDESAVPADSMQQLIAPSNDSDDDAAQVTDSRQKKREKRAQLAQVADQCGCTFCR